MIGFNPYNIYVILYGTPTYVDSSICPYLGNWVEDFVPILIFVRFLLRTSTFSCTL